MKLSQSSELQNRFKVGMQITGEDSEGNLEWLGSRHQWNMAEILDGDRKTHETENPWGDRDYPDMGDKVNDDLLDR